MSIGHWPPLFHVVQAIFFLLTGPSLLAAYVFQALVTGGAAAAAAVLASQMVPPASRNVTGAMAGLAVLIMPEVLNQAGMIMTDTFLSVIVLLTCVCWARYALTGRMLWALAFGMSASAAILTKGNAFGLAFMPALYAVLSGQYRLIWQWRTWFAAAIVVMVTGPWYVLTYKISADGFVYDWGLAYTKVALCGFATGAWQSFGPLGLVGFVAGSAIAAVRAYRRDRNELVLACASAAIGLFLFLLIAPADIQPRYLIALVPAFVTVAIYGYAATVRVRPWWPRPEAVIAVCLIINTAMTWRTPNTAGDMMTSAAHEILSGPVSGKLVLIASGSMGEGALIAAFAASDLDRTHYVIRASKALATSNFNGNVYTARFTDPEAVRQWIAENHISWMVLDSRLDGPEMLHLRQIAQLADAGSPGWRLVATHASAAGLVRVYAIAGTPPGEKDIEAVLRQIAPEKIVGGTSR